MLTDGRTDGRTELGIAIALSQIDWQGAKKIYVFYLRFLNDIHKIIENFRKYHLTYTSNYNLH